MNELDTSLTKLVDTAQRIAPEMVRAKQLEAMLDLAAEALWIAASVSVLVWAYRRAKAGKLEEADGPTLLAIIAVAVSVAAFLVATCSAPTTIATITNPAFYTLRDLLSHAK